MSAMPISPFPTAPSSTSSTSPATTGLSATCLSARARSMPRCWWSPPTTDRAPRRSSTWSCSTRLGIRHGVAVVTKTDIAGPRRVAEVVAAAERLLAGTTLAGSPVLAVSSVDGDGHRRRSPGARGPCATGWAGRRASAALRSGGSRLAIDRVFSIKGRGVVVTGTLRGGPLVRKRHPASGPRRSSRSASARCRSTADRRGGRSRPDRDQPRGHRRRRPPPRPGPDRRPDVVASDRMLVRLAAVAAGSDARPAPPRDRRGRRDHRPLRPGRDRPGRRVGRPRSFGCPPRSRVAPGDRLVLRRHRGPRADRRRIVLDVAPPRGISRRRQTAERVVRLAAAVEAGDAVAIAAARLDLHGALAAQRFDGGPLEVALGRRRRGGRCRARCLGRGAAEARPLAEVRDLAARTLRRLRHDPVATRRRVRPTASSISSSASGRLVRDGAAIGLPGTEPPSPAEGPRPGGCDGPAGGARWRLPRRRAGRSRPRRRVPAARDPRARADRSDRRPRCRPRVRSLDLPGPRRAGARPGRRTGR